MEGSCYLQLLLMCQQFHTPLFKPRDETGIVLLQAISLLLHSHNLILHHSQKPTRHG